MLDDHTTLPGFCALEDTEFMRVFEHPDLRVMLAERKQGAPMAAEDVEPAHRELIDLGLHAKGWGLIVDTRLITGNSDARFEAAIGRVNELLLGHFGHMAVLVRSAIGRLQATRLTDPGGQILVTTDVEAALEFVTAP